MTDCVVLMYHRVCERSADTACYFARGTAVEPSVFRAQLDWLAQHSDVVSLPDWWRTREDPAPSNPRPVVALTFDDAYRDCLEHVQPACEALQLPWAVFSVADAAAGSAPLWTDLYYAILTRGGDRIPELDWLVGADVQVPTVEADLRWWVRGAPKEALTRMPLDVRLSALARLADELQAEVNATELARTLYCSLDELRALARAGVTVGGHGGAHVRLADVPESLQRQEAAASAQLLDRLGVQSPRFFAYPDGSFDASVAQHVQRAGFVAAFTVMPGVADHSTDPFALPRHIVRNLRPGEPSWCAAFATKPAETEGGAAWA